MTGAGVKVAVVDTGIACGHPDLPLLIDGFNALPGGVSYCDDHGHGTHIAGIIAAQANHVAIRGAAPQVSLVAVKVLDFNGKGLPLLTSSTACSGSITTKARSTSGWSI